MGKKKPAPAMGEIFPEDLKELARRDQGRWEDSLVETACIILGVPKAVRTSLRRDMEMRSGESRLCWAMFLQQYPEFPVFLKTEVIANIGKKVTVSKMLTDFRKTLVAQRFAAWDALDPKGLVFRWPRLGGFGSPVDGLVVHSRESSLDVPGTRITWRAPGGERLTACALRLLIREIKEDGWRP